MGAERAAWIALSLISGMGAKRLSNLLTHFNGDLSAILAADSPTLRRVPDIGEATAAAIRSISLERVTVDIARWTRVGVRILIQSDSDYPRAFARLKDAPPTLFVRENSSDNPFVPDPFDLCLNAPCVAVVGTRQPSDAGAIAAREIGDAIGRGGGTVVSGFALGVDFLAHGGGVINGGRSIAVLGSGVLNVFPPEHRANVSSFMAKGGVFMSEVAPDANVSTPQLIARNRLISGLSRAVVVVESKVDGGAMHTVRFARAQGVPVYTLDLDVSGNRTLIAEGVRVLNMDAVRSGAWFQSLDALPEPITLL